MTWRIVEICSCCKLELKLGYMVIRGDETKRIHLSEIAIVILDSTAISLTAALLCELNRRKIKIIFCDEKRCPYGELIPYFGSCDSVNKLRTQMRWNKTTISEVWKSIIREKILNQSMVLYKTGLNESASMLNMYVSEIEDNDCTNREGHAAKVYFNSLFGKSFSRKDDNVINARLNYGYSILMSAFSREISICGYTSQIGIFHSNAFNPFNLASDLMEPLRPMVDKCVLDMHDECFCQENKQLLINILNDEIIIDGKRNYVTNAIRIFTESFFDAMNNDAPERMKFYEDTIHESNGIL